MQFTTKPVTGFRVTRLRTSVEPHAFHYLGKKMPFWVAVLSLVAFVTGNMVGQHGWHVFWKSVLGEFDDSLIVYEGTVAPIDRVPDYRTWSLYGGDARAHTFRQVPQDLLIPLPLYKPAAARTKDDTLLAIVYSVDHFGTYETGAGEGGHVGIDIRVPEGTPVRSVMQGIVVKVGEQPSGFGKFVMIKHPRVPSPENPKEMITVYSLYAHLSSVLVSEGTTLRKSEELGLSGMTGNASGPHLHYQIQRETCLDSTKIGSNPFWSFTTEDMKKAGMSFSQAINSGLNRDYGLQCTVNPMAYIQADYPPLQVAANQAPSSSSRSRAMTLSERREQRIRTRETRAIALKTQTLVAMHDSGTSQIAPPEPRVTGTHVAAAAVPVRQDGNVATIELLHDGVFSRGWEKLRIRLLDQHGRVVRSPNLQTDLYLRTAYGDAEFRPETLSALDFQNGEAVVEMLPRGKTTVVISVQPQGIRSAPMKYVRPD